MPLTNPGTPFDEDGWADALGDIRKLYLRVSGGANDLNQASEDVSQTINEEGYLRIVQNLADILDAAAARNNLGLGSLAVQDADAVLITGGSVNGVTVSGAVLSNPIISGGTASGTFIGAATISGSTIGGGTICGTTITVAGATLSGSTLINPTVSGGTHVAGTYSGNTILSPTISGGTLVGSTLSGSTIVCGTISSLVTDLAVADGGTGQSSIGAFANAFSAMLFATTGSVTTTTYQTAATGVHSFASGSRYWWALFVGPGGGGAGGSTNAGTSSNAYGGGGGASGEAKMLFGRCNGPSTLTGITYSLGAAGAGSATGGTPTSGTTSTLTIGSTTVTCNGGQRAGGANLTLGGGSSSTTALDFGVDTGGNFGAISFPSNPGRDGRVIQLLISSGLCTSYITDAGLPGRGWSHTTTADNYGQGGFGGAATVSGTAGTVGELVIREW